MERYRYPDNKDEITVEFIDSHEPYPGYWAESEIYALEKLEQYLHGKDVLPDQSRTVMDVGCGQGRLLPWFYRFANKMTGQEPDAERLSVARDAFGAAEFIGESIYDMPDSSSDIVICSHVIQHVPSDELEPLLGRLRELTAPGGLLVLMFSRGAIGREGFYIATVGEYHEVNEDEFNDTLKSDGEGQLPFRLFDPEKLKETARRSGWQPDWEWTFHILEKDEFLGMTVEKRDELVNASPSLSRQMGRDMMMVWRRDDS